MSHEIETNGDQAAAVFAREPAWHKLGTVKKDGWLTDDEVLDDGHLRDWNVRTVQVATVSDDPRDNGILVPDTHLIVRDNPWPDHKGQVDVLSKGDAVGNQWTPFQNEEMLEFGKALVEQADGQWSTAGSLDGGRRVFMMMELPQHITVGDVDDVALNLGLINYHSGSGGLAAIATQVRIVCANTERAALANNKGIWKTNHTAGMKDRVAEAQRVLRFNEDYINALDAELERMIQTPMKWGEFEKKIIPSLYTAPRVTDSDRMKRNWADDVAVLRNLWDNDETQNLIKNTRWGAYNTVTEYEDHYRRIATSLNRDYARAQRAVAGPGVQIKEKAFNLLSVPEKKVAVKA